MKQKRTGHERNGLNESRCKAARIETKRQQIDLTEALLQTHEAQEDRDHDYELHLRAKLRQARNQLLAMGCGDIKMEDF